MLRLLGQESAEISPLLFDQLENAKNLLEQIARLDYYWSVFEKDDLSHLLEGQDIQAHLGRASKVLILATSLGSEVDFEIRRAQAFDMPFALVLDAYASVLVETFTDHVELGIRTYYQKNDLYLSTRFAPGYGDFPLQTIGGFLDLIFPINQQIYCEDNGLMKPAKSILTIMGLGTKEEIKADMGEDPCSVCFLMGQCSLRSRGGYCGKFERKI